MYSVFGQKHRNLSSRNAAHIFTILTSDQWPNINSDRSGLRCEWPSLSNGSGHVLIKSRPVFPGWHYCFIIVHVFHMNYRLQIWVYPSRNRHVLIWNNRLAEERQQAGIFRRYIEAIFLIIWIQYINRIFAFNSLRDSINHRTGIRKNRASVWSKKVPSCNLATP